MNYKKYQKLMIKFIKHFSRTNNLMKSTEYIQNKFKLTDNFIGQFIYDLYTNDYISGLHFDGSSIAGSKRFTFQSVATITQKGYKFVDDVFRANISFWLYPFKTVILIIITASLTTFVNNLIEKGSDDNNGNCTNCENYNQIND